jgi:hypothetical protein
LDGNVYPRFKNPYFTVNFASQQLLADVCVTLRESHVRFVLQLATTIHSIALIGSTSSLSLQWAAKSQGQYHRQNHMIPDFGGIFVVMFGYGNHFLMVSYPLSTNTIKQVTLLLLVLWFASISGSSFSIFALLQPFKLVCRMPFGQYNE